jgi:hypothetical protein
LSLRCSSSSWFSGNSTTVSMPPRSPSLAITRSFSLAVGLYAGNVMTLLTLVLRSTPPPVTIFVVVSVVSTAFRSGSSCRRLSLGSRLVSRLLLPSLPTRLGALGFGCSSAPYFPRVVDFPQNLSFENNPSPGKYCGLLFDRLLWLNSKTITIAIAATTIMTIAAYDVCQFVSASCLVFEFHSQLCLRQVRSLHCLWSRSVVSITHSSVPDSAAALRLNECGWDSSSTIRGKIWESTDAW